MRRSIYCVQFDRLSGGQVGNVSVHCCAEAGHEPARCPGRGHDWAGGSVHVWAASPTRALMKALRWSRRRAKNYIKWLEEERNTIYLHND